MFAADGRAACGQCVDDMGREVYDAAGYAGHQLGSTAAILDANLGTVSYQILRHELRDDEAGVE